MWLVVLLSLWLVVLLSLLKFFLLRWLLSKINLHVGTAFRNVVVFMCFYFISSERMEKVPDIRDNIREISLVCIFYLNFDSDHWNGMVES